VLLALSPPGPSTTRWFRRGRGRTNQRDFFSAGGVRTQGRSGAGTQAAGDAGDQAAALGRRAELKARRRGHQRKPEQRKEYEAALKAEEVRGRRKRRPSSTSASTSPIRTPSTTSCASPAREPRRRGSEAAEVVRRLAEEIEEKTGSTTRRSRAQGATERLLAFVQRREAAQGRSARSRSDPGPRQRCRRSAGSKYAADGANWIANLKNSWGSETVDRCQNCHIGRSTKGRFSEPWGSPPGEKANLPEADMKSQVRPSIRGDRLVSETATRSARTSPVRPMRCPSRGSSAAEPSPMDPAAGHRDAAARRLGEVDRAGRRYCGSRKRARSPVRRRLLKDARARCSSEQKPSGRASRATPALDALKARRSLSRRGWRIGLHRQGDVAALDEAGRRTRSTSGRSSDAPAPVRAPGQEPRSGKLRRTTCHGAGAQTKGSSTAPSGTRGRSPLERPPHHEVTVMRQEVQGRSCSPTATMPLAAADARACAGALEGQEALHLTSVLGCHPIEGYNELAKRGPTLTNIASKTTQGWLQTWIAYPKAGDRQPGCRNFWPGAVDASWCPIRGAEA